MSDTQIQIEIMTPQRPLAEAQADEVSFPAEDGYMGILPRHTPLVAELGIGKVTFRQGGEVTRFMVNGGFVQVHPDRITILANEAQAEADLDREQAEADLKRSEVDLAAAKMPEEVEAALTLARAAKVKLDLLGKK